MNQTEFNKMLLTAMRENPRVKDIIMDTVLENEVLAKELLEVKGFRETVMEIVMQSPNIKTEL